ncbi:hypothetical protein [Plantactinospora alkalitolerans]|uniref:hypothetical protein n=1 Tax=Plantactinospora alkalitolerans TaxID=2789879 RepID=UPI001E46AFF9|nr:hypothetical protein [Plantactinospora alkalitolerans]
MSVDPTGSSDVPPPTDPWPTDASISPEYPPTAPLPPAPPTPAPPSSYQVPAQPYPGVGQPYPVPAQPYPGGGQPVSGPPWLPATGPESVIAQIGEITVTSSTVRTPSGDIPLAGTQWHVADYWQSEQKTPTWAIVVAVVGFCVLTVFSLLFLLIKETVHRGTVQVTVTNGPRQYVARIPVTSEPQVQQIHQQVNYVRSLAAI